ncbi:hypothetical protein [Streptomyces sp. YKOK-I1]
MPASAKLAAVAIAAAALLGASPAGAQTLAKWSPNSEAYAWSKGDNSTVSIREYSDNYSHVDYYRAASQSTQRHLWNKSGINTTATSGSGSAIFKLRTCEWVKDNDDICSGWDY